MRSDKNIANTKHQRISDDVFQIFMLWGMTQDDIGAYLCTLYFWQASPSLPAPCQSMLVQDNFRQNLGTGSRSVSLCGLFVAKGHQGYLCSSASNSGGWRREFSDSLKRKLPRPSKSWQRYLWGCIMLRRSWRLAQIILRLYLLNAACVSYARLGDPGVLAHGVWYMASAWLLAAISWFIV